MFNPVTYAQTGITLFQIGPYKIASTAVLAPMAGVTDQPFRHLCKQFGAGMVTAEMLTADTRLWNSRKSQQRLIQQQEPEPRAVQIAGGDAQMLAQAAQACVELGAQIVDINMGCPAKKVCNKAAGSALLQNETLVAEILDAVVSAVDVPVTLKIRTGWSLDQRNGLAVAKLAQESGVQALYVHGRSRACRFKGDVEYDTIAEISQSLDIPVIANGDIDSPIKAEQVLKYTGAAGIMIGRAAQGRPWIFNEINHYLQSGELLAPPEASVVKTTLINHLQALHQFYGDYLGVRIARKHVGWYLLDQARNASSHLSDSQAGAAAKIPFEQFRQHFNRLESTDEQKHNIEHHFDGLTKTKEEKAA